MSYLNVGGLKQSREKKYLWWTLIKFIGEKLMKFLYDHKKKQKKTRPYNGMAILSSEDNVFKIILGWSNGSL